TLLQGSGGHLCIVDARGGGVGTLRLAPVASAVLGYRDMNVGSIAVFGPLRVNHRDRSQRAVLQSDHERRCGKLVAAVDHRSRLGPGSAVPNGEAEAARRLFAFHPAQQEPSPVELGQMMLAASL